MQTLKTFLAIQEADSRKTAVFTFGSFNPPHKGHDTIFEQVYSIAKTVDGTPFIFPSITGPDKSDKYPLEWKEKIEFLNCLFPYDFIANESIKNPFQAVGYLGEEGYTDIVMVVGSDRVNEFKRRFNRSDEFFESFEVVSGGERIAEDNSIAGMSSTKARNAANENNIDKFKVVTGWTGEIAESLMEAIQNGIKK